jgi:hypothetical protein
MIHQVSHTIAGSIPRLDFGSTFTIGISAWQHISNVIGVYWSSNKVNSIGDMLKHNNCSTSLLNVEGTLWYLALQGKFTIK